MGMEMGLFLKEKLQKISKKKLITLILVSITILSVGLFLPLKLVRADMFGVVDIIVMFGDAVLEAFMTVLWIVLLVSTIVLLSNVLIAIGAAFLNWAISLNLNVLLTRCGADPCIVDAGWAFSRDLANMFFILALVFIAFATILGIETYGMRKMLVPLILIALVINFSQLFIGVVVDFASVFMRVFSEPLIDWVTILGQSITAQFYIFLDFAAGLFSPILSKLCPWCDVIFIDPMTAIIVALAKILFMTAYNILSGIMFLTLGGVFLLRIPMIWVLTIIAPMGLICYLFPFLRDKYRWWIKQVGQWVFIGVFALFFTYLGTLLWRIVWDPGWATSSWKASEFGTGFLIGDLGPWFVRYILPGVVYLLFLFLGLHFAAKTSAIFAGAIIGGVTAFGKQLQGRIKSQIRKTPIKMAESKLSPTAMERRAKFMESVPILGTMWGKTRADDYRKMAAKKRGEARGKIGTGEKAGETMTAEQKADAVDKGYLDPLETSGIWRKASTDNELKDFYAHLKKKGWSDNDIRKWQREKLTLLEKEAPKKMKDLYTADPRLAEHEVVQRAVDAPGKAGKLISSKERAQILAANPGHPEIIQEIAAQRAIAQDLARRDWRKVSADSVKGKENLDVRIAIVKNLTYQDMLSIARDNKELQEELQKHVFDMEKKKGKLWNNARQIAKVAGGELKWQRGLYEHGWRFRGKHRYKPRPTPPSTPSTPPSTP